MRTIGCALTCALAMAACGTASPVAPTPTGSLSAQERWASQLSLPPLDVAMAVVDAGIPVGIEVRRGEDFPTVRIARSADQAMPSIEEMSREFNRRHQAYRSIVMEGVFVVRPAEQVAAILDREVDVSPGQFRGVLVGMRAVLSTIDPSLVGGVAGSFINTTPEERGEFTEIIVGGRRPLIAHLNAVFRQTAPPQGWMVVTDRLQDQTVLQAFGQLYSNGSSSRAAFEHPPR